MNQLTHLIFITTVFTILFCAGTAGQPYVQKSLMKEKRPKLGIYDGTGTTIKKHPYLVAITVEGEFVCAGTILSRSWVISIGDLFFVVSPEDVGVVAGSSFVNGTAQQVTNIVIHPKYADTDYDYDYALLQLEIKLNWSSKIKAIKLPSKAPKVKTKMVVAGWGEQTDSDQFGYTPVLRQGTMTWVGAKVCKTAYNGTTVEWTNRMACAYNKTKTTPCLSDRGDPFVSDGVLYGMFVIGLTEGFCSSQAGPSLLANVHTVVSWIKTTIA